MRNSIIPRIRSIGKLARMNEILVEESKTLKIGMELETVQEEWFKASGGDSIKGDEGWGGRERVSEGTAERLAVLVQLIRIALLELKIRTFLVIPVKAGNEKSGCKGGRREVRRWKWTWSLPHALKCIKIILNGAVCMFKFLFLEYIFLLAISTVRKLFLWFYICGQFILEQVKHI